MVRIVDPKELPEELRNDRIIQWAEAISEEERFHHEDLYPYFLDLSAQYLALLKRFNKIAKISDGFQHSLKEANALLDKAARRDYLTGLPNRRDMIERIESEISRAKRHDGAFSIIISDIDRFKAVNDTYGHEAGDLVLKSVSEVLRRSLRLEDHCARWGGEEFLICLPQTSLSNAAAVAEKLKENVAASRISYLGTTLSVTASLGVSCHQPEAKIDEVIRAADRAMLAAKRKGRNRVEIIGS